MKKEKIIFFDGVCNLCNGFINYVIKRDKRKIIYYATLQSNITKTKLKDYKLPLETDYTTIYYYANNKLYSKSSAVLNIFLELSSLHRITARVLLLIPKFIRDAIYALISKNRYKLFGKKETCRLPTEQERKQFL